MKHFFFSIILLITCHLSFAQSLTDSLKAYYPFNGNTNDASGYGHNGIPLNGVALAADRFGNPNSAYYFDGINDYIELATSNQMRPMTFPVSISAWVKFSGVNPTIIMASDNNNTGNTDSGFWFQLGGPGAPVGINYGDAGLPCQSNARRTKIGSSALNDNLWHLVVGVIRGPTNMDLYVDCMNDGGTYSGTGGNLAYSPINMGKIGSFNCNNSTFFYFSGYMDEIRFYHRELSPTDVAALYNYPTPISGNMATGILGNDTTICGGSISLDATTTWVASYSWSNGSTTSSINVSQPGTYWVNITGNDCGQSGADTITVSAGTQPAYLVDTVVCKGQTIFLDAPTGYSNYSWNTGATTQSISVASPGTYILQATNSSGCNLNDTIVVTSLLQNAPMAQFTYTFQPFGMIQLNNTSLYSSQYQWTYSNGGVDTTFSPQHYFPCNTPITVTLISAGRCGADTAIQTITYICDAIENIEQSIDLKVFPKPAQSMLNIEYELKQPENVQIYCYNTLGQKVYEQSYFQQVGKITQTISVNKWVEGYYLLQITTEKGIATQKIWVKK